MADEHLHHHHSPVLKSISRAFIAGIVLNLLFVVIEFTTGFYTHSLALLSDAGHNLSDVATLGLSLFAFEMAKKKPTEKYTYGYNKSTIIASLANAVILLIAVGSIGWEATQRFIHPQESKGNVISIVAGIGIVINAASALFFFKEKDNDLNVKGAYLHLMVDALVSVGVVIAGLIISYTGLMWIDPAISLAIMAIVIYSTWGLLKESLRLSLDAVPQNIEVEKIKTGLINIPGVTRVYHIHVWAMSTTKNAITVHMAHQPNLSPEQIHTLKEKARHSLTHLNIQHATLETDSDDFVDAPVPD